MAAFISGTVALFTSFLGVSGTIIGSVLSSFLYQLLSGYSEEKIEEGALRKPKLANDIVYIFPLVVIGIIELIFLFSALHYRFDMIFDILESAVSNNLFRLMGIGLILLGAYPYFDSNNIDKRNGTVVLIVGVLLLLRGLMDISSITSKIFYAVFAPFDSLFALIVVILLFPFDSAGIDTLKIFVNESIVVDIKYIIVGILFVVASLTDFFDGYFARKNNCCTDFGKMIDAIADKILIDSVLVLLATIGFIHPVIAVVVMIRDVAVDSIKRYAASRGLVIGSIKLAKVKTILFMVSISMTLFYNLPFELFNLKIADILLVVATIMSVVSGFEYYGYIKKKLKID